MNKKRIIEGRRMIDARDLFNELKKILNTDDDEYADSIYLQGNQYIIIEVVENE